MQRFLWVFGVLFGLPAHASDNLVLVTLDGLRWQELFRGIDLRLAEHDQFSHGQTENLKAAFARGDRSAEVLLPFFHGTLARQGVVFGNRDRDECMNITNPWYFSYPGYNEILTGRADPAIDSNQKQHNPNVTFLEWLNGQPHFRGKVEAFASWDVFPYIINTQRSAIPVNAGFDAYGGVASDRVGWLNQMQANIPSPWANVRLDAFTQGFALAALEYRRPRVLYIAYGETDDFAHDGRYDQYLYAAQRTDRFLQELWSTLQAVKFYRGKTTLLITTDHGRGEMPLDTWQHHASKRATAGYLKSLAQYPEGIQGSNEVWFAALGPQVDSAAFREHWRDQGKPCLRSDQIAATALRALGFDPQAFAAQAGEAIALFSERMQ